MERNIHTTGIIAPETELAETLASLPDSDRREIAERILLFAQGMLYQQRIDAAKPARQTA